MRVRFALPAPELRSLVSLYWSWTSHEACSLPRTFPSIHTEIVLHYGAQLDACVGGRVHLTAPRVHIVGPGVPYTDLSAQGGVEFFAIRLLPGTLASLCRMPGGELHGRLTAVKEINVELYRALQPVLDTVDFQTQVLKANHALLKLLRPPKANRLDALALFARLVPDDWSVRNMAHAAGWSERHLGRVFRDEVGTAPLEFLRVLRFQNTLFRMAAQPSVDLSELALDQGYYDQAHLNRDVRRFSGRTPAFLKRNTLSHDLFFPEGSPASRQNDDGLRQEQPSAGRGHQNTGDDTHAE